MVFIYGKVIFVNNKSLKTP